MKTMQKRNGSSMFILLSVITLLSLAIVCSLGMISQNTAYASGNGDMVAGQGLAEIKLNELKMIELVSEDYSYVDYVCDTDTTFVYTISGVNGKVATKVLTYDESEQMALKTIASNAYSAQLKKGQNYKIGFKAEKKQTATICIKTQEDSFEWIIDGNKISEKNISLLRGNSYSVSFYINGMISCARVCAVENSKYNFSLNYGSLIIDSDCAVKGDGFCITAISECNECLDEITVIPEFSQSIKVEGVFDNGIERGIYWAYQQGITELTYTVQYLDKLETVTIDSIGDSKIKDLEDGQVYKLDVLHTLNKIQGNQGNATVNIAGAKFSTADNATMDFAIRENAAAAVPLRLTWVGSGTSSNPYQISSTAHFNDIESKDGSNVYFKQTQNLNFSYSATARDVRFDGIYNGNGKDLYGIYITSSSPMFEGGMFDRNYGTIENIDYMQVIMSFSHFGYVGGMVGANYGTVRAPVDFVATLNVHCKSSMLIVYVGGIVGSNIGSLQADNEATITMFTDGGAGGLAGSNSGNVTSYQGHLGGHIWYDYLTSSAQDVGGYIGHSTGLLLSVYSTNSLTIDIYVQSSSSSIKPCVGGAVGRASSDTINGCTSHSSYTGNLTSAQKTYVNFTRSPYVGKKD